MRTADVIAFIDWNSQAHAAIESSQRATIDGATRTMQYVGRVIGTTLHSACEKTRFRVSMRLYYGWRRGFEVTNGRKALLGALQQLDLSEISQRSNVVIRDDVELGDRLLSARAERLHSKFNCHLPNTYRRSLFDEQRFEEKMVDTALASDLVHCAHAEPNDWLVVLGEDDDLAPPLITADAIRFNSDTMVLLARSRATMPFLKIGDLTCRPSHQFRN